MEIRVLRYFLAVVDEGSVTAAARSVHVAQPSLSRQIRALEGELGVELFTRDRRRVRLSPAGRRFLPIVRDLVARTDSARTAMTALARGAEVELVVAAHPTTIADVIAHFVAARGRNLTVPRFVSASADEAYRLLERAEVDVALSAIAPPRWAASLAVSDFPIWAQVAPTHRWAGLDEIPLATLLTEPLVVLDQTHGTRRALDDVVGTLGASYETRAEVSVARIAQALAAAGEGVAVVTDDPIYDLHGLRIEAPAGPLNITLHAAWSSTHYAAESIRTFVGRLRDFSSTDGMVGGVRPQGSSRQPIP